MKSKLIWLITGALLIASIYGIFFYVRTTQRKEFNNLYNEEYYLMVNYGKLDSKKSKIIDKGSFMKEKNVNSDYYLYITKNNTLYTFYQKEYYTFDPMEGYVIDYKFSLNKNEVDNIINDIMQKKKDTLITESPNNYLIIRINNQNSYIEKKDLQLILQKNNIVLSL